MANPLLAAAVDIRRWLDQDADTPYGERLARDRDIGRQLDASDDLSRVLGWWELLRKRGEVSSSEAGGGLSHGARLVALERLAVWLLVLAGLLLGGGLGLAAFAYDGQHPVNLLALLGILVGVPFLLLLLTLVFLLPGRIPGLAAIREGIGVINPGRWAGAWLDRIAGMDLYGGFSTGRSAFARWQLVVFSQWLALGYFAGVLVTGAMLVTVTDLAFGWSTTLDLDARSVRDLFALLALPWQSWLPGAVPDLELVEASRFYRLETAAIAETEAMRLGGWWPFVLLSIFFWGFLPRLVLLLVGRWRLTREMRSLLCQDPEVLSLLDRLSLPQVNFETDESPEQAPAGGAMAGVPQRSEGGDWAMLIWNDAMSDEEARAWLRRWFGVGDSLLLRSSARSGGADVLAALRETRAVPSRVLLICKGWEPPLLEFVDFIDDLRAVLGREATLIVAPVNTRKDGVDPEDRRIWAEFLGRRVEGRLYVQQATTGDAGQATGAARS